jgi:hypothetical protein
MYYEQRLPIGTTLKVYHLGTLHFTVLPSLVLELLSQIKSNIGSYVMPRMFEDLTIEIWDPKRTDNPINSCGLPDRECESGSKYAGLGSKNFIQLRFSMSDQPNAINYLANLLGHEFGHHYAAHCGFVENNSTNLMQRWWDTNRKIHCVTETPPGELFAEDFRLLLGPKEAKATHRGTYLQGDGIWGLKDMMLLWPFFNYHCEKILCKVFGFPLSKIVLDDYSKLTGLDEPFSIKYTNVILNGLVKYSYFLDKQGLQFNHKTIHKFI